MLLGMFLGIVPGLFSRCIGVPIDCSFLDDGQCVVGICDEFTGQCVEGSAFCGNGIVDEVCGETCDPPDGEICNDGADNDGDGRIVATSH